MEKFICGICGDYCSEYTYNEEKDVDECNNCEDKSKKLKPDYFLLLPYFFKNEIIKRYFFK